MKKFILIFLLSTIGIFSVDSQNRTPKRDGNFEWVLVESNGNQGAETTDGKTLLPLKFKSVLFLNGYFQTWNPNGAALYNRWGECLIPETRNYQAISVNNNFVDDWFIVYNDQKQGLCNAKGQEIISPKRGYTFISPDDQYGKMIFYVTKGVNEGVCDISGREIISPDRGYTSVVRHLDQDSNFYYSTKIGDSSGKCDEYGNSLIEPEREKKVDPLPPSNIKKKEKYAEMGGYLVFSTAASLYREGNYTEAVEMLKSGAEKLDHAECQFALGLLYDQGKGVPKDSEEAAKWFRKAADKGLAKAQYSLGIYYIKGDGTKIKEGYDLLKKAADQAYAPAIELLKTLQQ